MSSLTDKLSEMEDDNEPPTIKLGDASVAAPFTSKLANVQASKSASSSSFALAPIRAHTSMQSRTSFDKVDALWWPPHKCTRFWL